jgi:hypothetical protein
MCDQVCIDVDRAEIVDENSITSLRFGDETIQKRGLSGAEKSTNNRHRDCGLCGDHSPGALCT